MATTSGKLDAIKEDMEMVSAICAESQDLRNLLKNPIVKSKDKIAVFLEYSLVQIRLLRSLLLT